MPPRNRYRFDPSVGRHRDARTGRLVPGTLIRSEVDRVLRASSKRTASLMSELRTGTLTLEGWETAMREELRLTHTAVTLVAKGGRAQMQQPDFGRLGADLRFQYQRLTQFADQIATGQQRLDGRAGVRADLYAQSARGQFHAVERSERADHGYTEERSILHPGDHCEECVAEAEKGWQPLGLMVPISHRQCLTRCRCTAQFRAESGTVAA